ncbi:MAG: HIT family protein [Nanoarchaeota archaeon]
MGCAFCNRNRLEKELITETKNFLVVPTIGQIVEGYTLIIPKKHVLCFGLLSSNMLEEYIELKDKVDKAITTAYQKPMYFEHGIVGQTVPHAHMHCVPSNADLLPGLLMRNYSIKGRRVLSSELGLKDVVKDFGPYYYYEHSGFKIAFDVNVSEMALRIALADTLDIPEAADWRNVNKSDDEKSMKKTIEKLKKILNNQ